MLLAEDLLLLVTDDASGRLSVPGVQADAGLGGANLVELTLLGKVDVAGEQDPGKPGRIIVRDPSPPGDEVLDAALQTLVARQGSKPSAVIRPLGKNLRPVLYQRLAASGVLRAGRGRALGIFPTRPRAAPGHLPPPDVAGAGSQPRGRDAPARDPGAGPAVRAGRADRRAHRP